MTALPRSGLSPHRYRAAALIACLVFGLLELGFPWTAGPARAEMHTPVGMLASFLASRLPGTHDATQTFHLFMAGEAMLVVLLSALMWWAIRPGSAGLRATRAGAFPAAAPLAVQVLGTCALGSLAFDLVLSAQLAARLPLRRAAAWMAALFVLGAASGCWTLAYLPGMQPDQYPGLCALLVFERTILLLGFGCTLLIRQEWLGRLRLAAANAQLRATQSLLSDTVRSSERLRIARDLHDAVGHHLTALHLHLDLAARQASAPASAHVGAPVSAADGAGRGPVGSAAGGAAAGPRPGAQPNAALMTARELAQTLLAEVRAVVSAERQEAGVNVAQALRLLCAGIPSPEITLRLDSGVDACQPAAAYTLLCCVQEAITNAVRHADAASLNIDITTSGGVVRARIADNGQGGQGAPEGNGLAGMRERLAAHGGELRTGGGFNTGVQHGYWLELWLPMAAEGQA